MFKKKSAIPVVLILCLCVLLVSFQKKRDFTREKGLEEDKYVKINEFLRQRGAQWVAGRTSVSDLSEDEKKSLLGSLVPDYVDPTKFYKITAVQQPASFSWLIHNGKNWVTSIRNQKGCGSCWAFALIAALETQYRWEQQNADLAVDISEQHLVSCYDNGDCCGDDYFAAGNWVIQNGVPSEGCFAYNNYPYLSLCNQHSVIACNPCNSYLNQTDLARHNQQWYITQQGFFMSDDQSILYSNDAVKNAVLQGPLVAHMTVYADFYDYVGQIYTHQYGEEKGGHAVLIVGYDTTGSTPYWICKNSWGTNWGENGFFKIAFDQVRIGTWTMRVAGISLANNAPVLTNPGNKSVKEGDELIIQLQATDPDGNPLTYSSPSLPQGAQLNSSTGKFTWTPSYTQGSSTTSNQFKVYPVTFKATDGLATDTETINITVNNRKKAKGRF